MEAMGITIIWARDSGGSKQNEDCRVGEKWSILGGEGLRCYILLRIKGGSVLTHLNHLWSGPLQHVFLGWVGFECSLQMRTEQS